MSVVFISILTTSSSYTQNSLELKAIKYVDSVVVAIERHNNILLRDSVSLAGLEKSKKYKYWNYYFQDTSKGVVNKVSISTDNSPEILRFYYEGNKVIRRDEFNIRNGQHKLIWTIYFKNDKEIYVKGENPERGIGFDIVGQAYYFLRNAMYCLNRVQSR